MSGTLDQGTSATLDEAQPNTNVSGASFNSPITLLQTTANYTLQWADPSVARTLQLNDPGVTTATFPFLETSNVWSGSTTQFTGNITKINNVAYSWPSTQSGVNQVLLNDGSGNLSWLAQSSVGAAWSSLSAPTANLSLAMGNTNTTFTWSTATGAATDLFKFIDTANNTGSGYLINFDTATGSGLKPFRVGWRGTDIITVNASGVPAIVGGTHTGITTLGIRDTSAAFDVTVAATSSTALTAGRTLTIDVVNAARTFKIGGNVTFNDAYTFATNAITFGGGEVLTLVANKNVTFADAFATSGAFSLTLTTTAITNATLPTGTITLVDLSSAQTLTTKTLSSPVLSGTTTGTYTLAGTPTISSTTAFTNSSPFSVANGQTLTVSVTAQTVGAATLTVPNFANVSDTFSFITLAQTLSNKTIASPVLSGTTTGTYTLAGTPTISSTVAFTNTSPFSVANGQTLTFSVTAQTVGAATLTIPNFANVNDTFAFVTLSQTLSNKTLPSPTFSGTIAGTYNIGGTPTLSSALALGGQNLTGTGTFTGTANFNSDVLRATSPRVTTQISDTNGNAMETYSATASAVNAFTLTNAATGGAVKFAATGTDTNIGLTLQQKGNAALLLNLSGTTGTLKLTDGTTTRQLSNSKTNNYLDLSAAAPTGTVDMAFQTFYRESRLGRRVIEEDFDAWENPLGTGTARGLRIWQINTIANAIVLDADDATQRGGLSNSITPSVLGGATQNAFFLQPLNVPKRVSVRASVSPMLAVVFSVKQLPNRNDSTTIVEYGVGPMASSGTALTYGFRVTITSTAANIRALVGGILAGPTTSVTTLALHTVAMFLNSDNTSNLVIDGTNNSITVTQPDTDNLAPGIRVDTGSTASATSTSAIVVTQYKHWSQRRNDTTTLASIPGAQTPIVN